MDRRKFLHFTSAGLAAGPSLVGNLAVPNGPQDPAQKRHFLDEKTASNAYRLKTEARKRPDIFFITLDMVSPDFYLPSRELSQQLNLPGMRSLIKDGVFFSNAFATSPLCAPSRASYLTGRYSYIWGNGERAPDGLETELRPNDVIFPEYLRSSGYITKQCGKGHVGTKKFIDAFGENDNSWNRWSPPIYDDENFLEYQRRIGIRPQRYSREIVLLLRDRKTPGNSVGGWIEQEGGKPFPLEGHYTYFLAHRAIDKLEDTSVEPNDRKRPLYLQLDIFDPHQPLSVPDGFQDREKALRSVMSPPQSYQKIREQDWRPRSDQPKVYDLYREYWGLYETKSLLDYRVAYALQMEVVDRTLSHYLDELKRRGLYDEAVIILACDHGEMNGRWGVIDKGTYLFPDVVRVPLVIKLPVSMGVKPDSISSPVSLMDIAPTLLDLAGVEPDARLDGRSLLPLLQGSSPGEDRELIFSCGWHIGVNFACGIQKWNHDGSHYLYSYNASSRTDELYDFNSADAENLASRPEHAKLRIEMIERMAAALRNDLRWLGFWAGFRVDNFFELPNAPGDMQLVEPR